MRFILFIIPFLFFSCSSVQITSSSIETQFGDLDILSIENSKSNEVLLLVLDDDTVSVQEQISAIGKVYGSKKRIYAFPKMDYKNTLRKNNTDSPKLRLENLVICYNHLQSEKLIDSNSIVTVMGIGEGSILSPHFSLNINADNLVLINPYYTSLANNMVLSMTEKSQNSQKLQNNLGFEDDSDWLAFIENAESRRYPDKIVGTRSMRFYSGYWKIDPAEYISNLQIPVYFILFDEYIYTSNYNNESIKLLNSKPNIEVINLSGNMFSNFSIEELKKRSLP